MAKEITVINERIVSSTRRGFLGNAGRAVVATAIPLQLVQAAPSKREEMAKALHGVVSQFDDENCPSHVQVCKDGQSLNLAMDDLLDNSVEEIEHLLLPLFGGAS